MSRPMNSEGRGTGLSPGKDTGTRWALAYTALSQAFVGAWALLAPRSFYDRFPGLPGFGAWVSTYGPYNEHLVRDVGGLYLSVTALALVALVAPRLATARAVGLATLAYAVPHLVYHAAHFHALAAADRAGHVLTIGGGVAVALFLASRPVPRPPAAEPPGHAAQDRSSV